MLPSKAVVGRLAEAADPDRPSLKLLHVIVRDAVVSSEGLGLSPQLDRPQRRKDSHGR